MFDNMINYYTNRYYTNLYLIAVLSIEYYDFEEKT